VATAPWIIRRAQAGDEAGAYRVCLETGNNGEDATAFYRDDPDALGRVFVGPYLAFEPASSLILEDEGGICGYALAALDSRRFYARYDAEWRPQLCRRFPMPRGDRSTWTRVQQVHHTYHQPDFYCPEPYDWYPSHLHIDLLPRAQGRGYGRRMIEAIMDALAHAGSAGAHLGVSEGNARAFRFYQHLGFRELTRVGSDDDRCIYMGRRIQER
jgi:ribosomal protein S18 acetylase RimI-like enzyme